MDNFYEQSFSNILNIMVNVVRIYYNLNRAVGLFNLHYDQKNGEFISYHKPTILYCALVGTAILALLPFIMIVFIKTAYYCEPIKSIRINTSLLIITDHASIVVILLTSWWKRQAICCWCNAFLKMLAHFGVSDTYEYYDIVQRTRKQLLQKLGLSSFTIVLLYIYLYGTGNGNFCPKTNDISYVLKSLFCGLTELIVVLIDYNLFLGLTLMHMILQILLKKLKEISHDIQLMKRMQEVRYEMKECRKTFNPHMWLKQLQGDVDAIAMEVAELKKMIYELVRILQMPYLCILLNAFQSLIAIIFHILRFTQQRDLDIITVIFYLIVLSANITNLMKSFQVCEYLCEDFKIFNEKAYALILSDNLRQAVNDNHADNSLILSLEILLLYLKQPFQLTLCGMFELNNNTGLSMLKSAGLNLLYLIQIVLSKNEM
ncbi:putative gustatory receptor 58c [Glossina fuscipes fuscipes]